MTSADDLLHRALDRAARQRRLPESTYRLQFHAGFTFRDAAAVVPYLAELGVTHLYASPYLRARPGSTHGYDVIDHCRLNPELGTDADFDALLAALDAHGMAHVLDTVPNHVGVGTNDNAWWNDVLENGPSSRYGSFFDIAWRSSPRPELHDKVLIPTLGAPYADVLEQGQFRLAFEPAEGSFAVFYYDRRFPVSPRTYGKILGHRLEALRRRLGEDDPALMEYLSILTAARHLPDRSHTDPPAVEERHREKEVIKHRLAALVGRSAAVRRFVDEAVAAFNGTPGDARSFDLLDDLLEHQCYRLSYWHVASDEINYRRFFDINDLAALAMERADVFARTHELILRLLGDGRLAGLRIDHPDGLYDPKAYFLRLQRSYVLACAEAELAEAAGDDAEAVRRELRERVETLDFEPPGAWPLYVVAEKILAVDEPLPAGWAVHGTSGYDFLNCANGLFVDPAGEEPLTRLYHDFAGDLPPFDELAYQKKRLILRISLASELHMLAHRLDRLAQRDRRSRDFTLLGLTDALREVIACFPVYRSYITPAEGVSDADRRRVEAAAERAIARNAKTDPSVFHFVRDAVLQVYPPGFTDADKAEQLRFAGKFQQLTAPVTAKGIEDTAFYLYNRLVSLNEVGGEPAHFGVAPQALHRYFEDRRATWPHAMSALSTHDTKRSEDVRARINVLSELPEQWRQCVERWGELNAPHRRDVGGAPAPTRNDEYLLYQTLVGAWPLDEAELRDGGREAFVERIGAYMQKAMREAKAQTSWTDPNAGYESAVREFVAAALDESTGREFLAAFGPFQRRVAHLGLLNSLSQSLLKLTAPGVPDTYQGTELWDFSLVDPDNRRPVDYDLRRRALDGLRARAGDDDARRALARELAGNLSDGRAKLYVTWQSLRCRREMPGLFSAGDYLPADATGPRAAHVFAFGRRHEGRYALVAVPRLVAGLGGPEPTGMPIGPEVWRDTMLTLPADLPAGTRLHNVFTGAELPLGNGGPAARIAAADLFADFPVALLTTTPPTA